MGEPPKPRVLVVDDYQDGADSLVLILQALGADASAVYDGQAAIRSLQTFRPDLVLLDIGMPGMNGLDVARLIRMSPGFEHIWLVAVSGWGTPEDRRQSTEAGFNAHLVKPLEFTALTTLLTSFGRR